ncbi:MAG: hypothetical protein Q7K42_03050 [Candidatus Diapherotrites archaeon]|nr:hypothetical protein [Candidatus Diapherotrites archaeon]
MMRRKPQEHKPIFPGTIIYGRASSQPYEYQYPKTHEPQETIEFHAENLPTSRRRFAKEKKKEVKTFRQLFELAGRNSSRPVKSLMDALIILRVPGTEWGRIFELKADEKIAELGPYAGKTHRKGILESFEKEIREKESKAKEEIKQISQKNSWIVDCIDSKFDHIETEMNLEAALIKKDRQFVDATSRRYELRDRLTEIITKMMLRKHTLERTKLDTAPEILEWNFLEKYTMHLKAVLREIKRE